MRRVQERTVAVLFGGRSPEHEVSIITGHQIMDALDAAGYSLLPIYITKSGEWFAGGPLYNVKNYTDRSFSAGSAGGVYRVSLSPDRSMRQLVYGPDSRKSLLSKKPVLWADVFFPALHGSFGEDGTLQGLLELASVPYVGSDVLAAAIGMDKVRMKSAFRDAGIPVLNCVSTSRVEWNKDPESFIKQAEAHYEYPLMVKPVTLGSSIGVKRCESRQQLNDAIQTALELDSRVLVERALVNFGEINCSVLGPPEEVSVCEQPCTNESMLTFDAKYRRGRKHRSTGAAEGGMAAQERIIPARISDELTLHVQELSKKAFRAIGASGVARLDFLLENGGENVYLNEINTMPGSLAFYLWEASGVPFDELVSKAVQIADERYRVRNGTRFTLETNLLQPLSSSAAPSGD